MIPKLKHFKLSTSTNFRYPMTQELENVTISIFKVPSKLFEWSCVVSQSRGVTSMFRIKGNGYNQTFPMIIIYLTFHLCVCRLIWHKLSKNFSLHLHLYDRHFFWCDGVVSPFPVQISYCKGSNRFMYCTHVWRSSFLLQGKSTMYEDLPSNYRGSHIWNTHFSGDVRANCKKHPMCEVQSEPSTCSSIWLRHWLALAETDNNKVWWPFIAHLNIIETNHNVGKCQ